MLSMMAASAVKRSSATRSTVVKKMISTIIAREHALAEDSAPHRIYSSTRHHPTARMLASRRGIGG